MGWLIEPIPSVSPGRSGQETPIVVSNELLHKLKTAAMKASQFAYCPYSGFRVGAAIETDGGEIFSGCNVENASFGLVICAERNAVFQAVAKKGKFILRAILIYTPTPKPSPPCG